MAYQDTSNLGLGLFTAAFSLSLFYAWNYHRSRPKLPFPPGPRKLPIIGNLLDVGKASEWEQYHQMCSKYSEFWPFQSYSQVLIFVDSDIVHLSVAGLSVIVLDTLDAAEELLVGRSTIYSDRLYTPNSSTR